MKLRRHNWSFGHWGLSGHWSLGIGHFRTLMTTAALKSGYDLEKRTTNDQLAIFKETPMNQFSNLTLYRTITQPIRGSSWAEVAPQARHLLRSIARRTKRRPYIRSAYFRKDKVFLSYFWQHLSQKPYPEQLRRLRYLPCAIELIRKSRHRPTSKQNPNRPDEILHRFAGMTPDHQLFMVQIKESQQTDRKELMSVFPYE